MPKISRLTGRVANEVQISGLRYESPGSEVIPDSEEERQRKREGPDLGSKVIIISSDESDGEDCTSITMSPTKPSVGLPGSSNHPTPRKYQASRRIFLSSDDDSEVEIIEASTTSERITRATDTAFKGNAVSRDDDPVQVSDDDDAIMVFDEPAAVKPLKKDGKILPPRRTRAIFEENETPSRSSATLVTGPFTPVSTPVSRRLGGKPATPRSRSEKAKLGEKNKTLHAYAEELFAGLNKTVFKDRLPASTKLNWNKRLLKTAGRAKYHRSRDGVQTVEIELAQKILDCEERIRNTLSHEMCHLATWIIDKKIDEHHGRLFKKWANLVMQMHPEIDVSVRHDYEISYPFEWKCEKCAKIYGRFSKSIRPDECVCGVCKEGTLIPLFDSKRTKIASKMSKFAANNPQGSPRTMPSGTRLELERTDTDAEDLAVEILASTLAGTSITL